MNSKQREKLKNQLRAEIDKAKIPKRLPGVIFRYKGQFIDYFDRSRTSISEESIVELCKSFLIENENFISHRVYNSKLCYSSRIDTDNTFSEIMGELAKEYLQNGTITFEIVN